MEGFNLTQVELIEPLPLDFQDAAPSILRPETALHWINAHHGRSPLARHALLILESLDTLDLAYETLAVRAAARRARRRGFPALRRDRRRPGQLLGRNHGRADRAHGRRLGRRGRPRRHADEPRSDSCRACSATCWPARAPPSWVASSARWPWPEASASVCPHCAFRRHRPARASTAPSAACACRR